MAKTEAKKKGRPHTGHSKARCRRIFSGLSDYLDRELSAADCRAIERHLRGCANCGAFLNTLKKTVALCRRSPAPALSKKLRAQILRRIRRAA